MKFIKNKKSKKNVEQDIHTDLCLQCQYCGEYLCYATETICNHVFCEQCIENYLLFVNQCPVCHQKLRNRRLYNNVLLDNMVQNYVQSFSKEDYSLLQLRREDYRSKRRFIRAQMLIAGLRIDARDKRYIWGRATINDIIKEANRTFIFVTYDDFNNDQVIRLDQRRLAILGSYTNRLELPHYKPGSNERVVIFKYGQLFELNVRPYIISRSRSIQK